MAKSFEEIKKLVSFLEQAHAYNGGNDVVDKRRDNLLKPIKEVCEENRKLTLDKINLESELKQVKFFANTWSDANEKLQAQVEVLKQSLNDMKL